MPGSSAAAGRRTSDVKILVDGIIFARQGYGGISTAWREYLKRMPDYAVDVRLLLPRRHRSTTLTALLQERPPHEVIPDHFTWPLRIFERPALRSTLVKRHLDASVEVFQSTYFSTVYGTSVPKVVMLYDMILEKCETGAPRKWTDWGIEIKRAVLHNADHIVAISESTKRDLLETYPSIAGDRVTVIPLAAETHRHDGASFPEVAAKLGLNVVGGEYLLYVGARHGYKNFQILMDLLHRWAGSRELRVLSVGGERSEQDRTALRSLGLERHVTFLETVSNDELSVLYRNALALVYPSRYEGFGLPVLEAMAAGCPVLCADAASLPEVGGDAALYFDPASVDSLESAINRLLSSPRADLVQRGLENAGRFSWDRSTRALVHLYRALVSRGAA